jgi:putative membrane protein
VLDLSLAIAHHLLIFALFAVLVTEFVVVRAGVSRRVIARIAAVDLWYGVLAGLILVVGLSRAIFAAKGWLYYSHNLFFWLKLGTFAAVGLLSVPPTIAFIRWRRAQGDPAPAALAQVRRLLWAEVGLFALLPVFAAAMARGAGEF